MRTEMLAQCRHQPCSDFRTSRGMKWHWQLSICSLIMYEQLNGCWKLWSIRCPQSALQWRRLVTVARDSVLSRAWAWCFLLRSGLYIGCFCLARSISHLGAFLSGTCRRLIASAFMLDEVKSGLKGGNLSHILFSVARSTLSRGLSPSPGSVFLLFCFW